MSVTVRTIRAPQATRATRATQASGASRATRTTRRPLSRARVVLTGGLVVGALLGLSGCGKSGLAAQVDDRTITVDRLQSAVASLHATDSQAFSAVTDAQVLAVLVYGPLAERAASAAGKGISDDSVRQALTAQAQQNNDKTLKIDRLNDAAIEALRGNVAFAQLDDAARADLLAQLKKADIEVSPRYGKFDPATGAITAPSPNWMTPSATPSPTAAATG